MKALIIVDMQRDFMPGGVFAVDEADQLVPLINMLMKKFPLVLATKDWHPKNHVSFAANHPGKKVGEVVIEGGIEQILWPVHCVQHTLGAEFVSGLNTERIEHVFHKGVESRIDSYSTFYDNAKRRETGLEHFLKKRGIKEIVLVGVATDYCVLYSALDALELGFDVTVVQDCCKAINLHPDDEKKALKTMKDSGARIAEAKEWG